MSIGANFFAGSQVSLTKKKKWMKKQIRCAAHGKNTRNYGSGLPWNKKKKPQIRKFGIIKFNGTFKCPLKVAKFQKWPSRFTHSWRLRGNNNIYLNVTEWLASPVAPCHIFETNRRNVKRRTECLFEVFICVLEEERWHVLQKVIHEIRKSRHWLFPSLSATQQTVF